MISVLDAIKEVRYHSSQKYVLHTAQYCLLFGRMAQDDTRGGAKERGCEGAPKLGVVKLQGIAAGRATDAQVILAEI